MGPYPHDGPPASISDDNPMGVDGFEFVEFAHPKPSHLHALFEQMGFSLVAKHRSKDVALYRQGDVNYVLNAEPTASPPVSRRATDPPLAPWGFGSRRGSRLCAGT